MLFVVRNDPLLNSIGQYYGGSAEFFLTIVIDICNPPPFYWYECLMAPSKVLVRKHPDRLLGGSTLEFNHSTQTKLKILNTIIS